MLHDDTRDGVEYVFGDRIVELTQDPDGVDVAFASGDRRRFDLVVGADGLHSALRAMVFGPHEQFVRHLGMVLAFYTVPNEFGVDRWLIDYQEPGRSAGLRPLPDATRAMAMLSFSAADFDVDYRDEGAEQPPLHGHRSPHQSSPDTPACTAQGGDDTDRDQRIALSAQVTKWSSSSTTSVDATSVRAPEAMTCGLSAARLDGQRRADPHRIARRLRWSAGGSGGI